MSLPIPEDQPPGLLLGSGSGLCTLAVLPATLARMGPFNRIGGGLNCQSPVMLPEQASSRGYERSRILRIVLSNESTRYSGWQTCYYCPVNSGILDRRLEITRIFQNRMTHIGLHGLVSGNMDLESGCRAILLAIPHQYLCL